MPDMPGPDNTPQSHGPLTDRRTLAIVPMLLAVVGLAAYFWLS
jgi:hypothetical protein